jgi:ubiquinone/menaquinone biosynthesis C-methylase UbiE
VSKESKDFNQSTYAAASIVNHYAQLNTLQPAEKAVLDLLKRQNFKLKMLDIGVGGGRTTLHFSEITSEYIGIDYSAEMISACKKRFNNAATPYISFEVCDARDLSQFSDNFFDFILFSFNGIDYASHDDRLNILKEISRIGKSGGYFFFSSHNLQGIEQEFDLKKQISFNPFKTYVNLVMTALLRFFNRSVTVIQLRASDHVILRDESHNFRLKTYYIRPKEQIHQLGNGFKDFRVYSWKQEVEIRSKQELESICDSWLYYLCTIQ